MKRYHIQHRTVYRYSAPVAFGIHRIVLRPREGHDITVVKHDLIVQPEASFFWMTDLYGNNVALVEIPVESDRLEIVNDVIIERLSGPADEAPKRISRASQVSLPVAYSQMEMPVINGYLETVFPDDRTAINRWATEQLQTLQANTALAAVEHLNRSVNSQIRYRRREERGVQTPATTLEFATGSCRDMATLLMEACRSLGLASRFVSGYLDAAAATAGRGSTHAWVEVYFPDNGWCGFDPTVGTAVSPKHVTVGVSAHPRGVMPISGIYDGPPGCYLGMEVAVTIRQLDASSEAYMAEKPIIPVAAATA